MVLLTLLTILCRGSLRSQAENCPLIALGEAEEIEEGRSGFVAVSAGELLRTVCQGSPPSPADSVKGLPGILGEAEEAEEAEESHPSGLDGTLLAILASVVHSPTQLIIQGYPVRAGGCRGTCAVLPSVESVHPSSLSATIYLSDPGLVAVHGPARACSVTLPPSPMGPMAAGGCRCVASATIYLGLAEAHASGPTRARSLTLHPMSLPVSAK